MSDKMRYRKQSTCDRIREMYYLFTEMYRKLGFCHGVSSSAFSREMYSENFVKFLKGCFRKFQRKFDIIKYLLQICL